nr:hypothetical protein [uncultured Mediterranean phage uvMED]
MSGIKTFIHFIHSVLESNHSQLSHSEWDKLIQDVYKIDSSKKLVGQLILKRCKEKNL